MESGHTFLRFFLNPSLSRWVKDMYCVDSFMAASLQGVRDSASRQRKKLGYTN